MFDHAQPLLPRTFWRFFLPILCVVSIAFVAATAVTYFTGLSAFKDFHARTAAGLLAGTAACYQHAVTDVDEFRSSRFGMQRERLREGLRDALTACALYENLVQTGRLRREEAQKLALDRLSMQRSDRDSPIVIVAAPLSGGAFRIISANIPLDVPPTSLLSTLDASLGAHGAQQPEEPPYVFATSFFSPEGALSPHLASAARFAPWGWLIAQGISMEAYKLAVAEKERSTLQDFNADLIRISSDLGGELIVFGEQCEVVATSLPGGTRHAPDGGQWADRCRAMIAAARERGSVQQPAEGHLARPAQKDRGDIFWAVRIPGDKLYAGYMLPRTVLANSAAGFVDTLTITGLVAVLVLGLALTLLLAGLLRPVSALSDAYRRLMSGDFTVRADERTRGEIGDLCRQFNAMARSLQELMQTEQLRQVELDEINKTLEAQVRVRTEALANKARELEEANLRLQEMDQLKTNFLQNVSHELRTPLTAVLGFAKLIHKDFQKHFAQFGETNPSLAERGGRVLRNLDIIISEGARLTRLINDVLDLAKIESGRMTWQDDLIDMGVLLESVAGTFRSRALESGVALELDIPRELPRILADSDRLTQVIVNLLDNAFKFTAQGSVRLRSWTESGSVVVEVRDTGTGIPTEDIEKIFDKFHQTSRRDTLRDKPPGTGLGLAICRQIVLRHGGTIFAASSPGEGTAVTVVLPPAPATERQR